MAEAVRPRHGILRRADGRSVPIRFSPTEDPLAFDVVDRRGRRVTVEHGDTIHVDALDAGQRVVIDVASTWVRA